MLGKPASGPDMRLPAFVSTLKFRIVAIVVATGMLSAWGTTNLLLDVTRSELTRVLMANDREDRERTAALLAGKIQTLKLALAETAERRRADACIDRRSTEDYLASQAALNTLFDTVFVARPDGTMVARVERGVPQSEITNVSDREYFQRALRTRQIALSDPMRGRIKKVPLLIMAVPQFGSDGAPHCLTAGVVALTATSLFTGVGDKRHAEAAIDLVIDRKGIILWHPKAERLLGNASDEPGLGELITRWQEAGSPVDAESTAQLSQGYLVSMAGIPTTDWLHLRVTPASVALQPLVAARRQAFSAAAIAGLLAALIAGALAWTMVRPISRLRARAERMLDVETPDQEPWPADAGEVGAMARAFRQLLEQRQLRQMRMSDLVLQLEAVLDNAEVGIALTNDGRFDMVSRRLCQMLRCERGQLVGFSTRMIYASDQAFEELSARARPQFIAHGVFEGELELVRGDGETFWARLRGRAVVPGDPTHGTIWVVDDVTQARQQREQLTWAATHDALTGLANRPAFEALLEQATAHSAEQPFCVLFIDLDRFKMVNDTGGHAAGDAMLRDVASELAERLRKSDTLARIGGDEFAVLLPQCPVEQAHAIAEKLRVTVEDYDLAWHGERFRVGASIGLVHVHGAHAGGGEVLRAADAACYAAKRDGRNRVTALTADV
jgi:diguanylate cyclase (GGDEF)-like protein/PAS domain S-box-containing protein